MAAPDGKAKDLDDDLDAGWDDDEEEDEDDIDAGWGDVEGQEATGASGSSARTRKRDLPPLRELTPEEREARTARVAARKQRLKTKAAEKADRRKAKASAAAAKQKKSMPRERVTPAPARQRRRPVPVAEPAEEASGIEAASPSRVPSVTARAATIRGGRAWLNGRTLAIAVLVLLVVGAVAFVVTRR